MRWRLWTIEVVNKFEGFARRMQWFIENRKDLMENVASMNTHEQTGRRLMALVGPDQLRGILKTLLDENEFLSPYGLRALSRKHLKEPYVLRVDSAEYRVDYEPGESQTGLFGGNSNWRGPVWYPLNFLLIESLQKFQWYYGDDFKVECPTGSGQMMTLEGVADELSRRLVRIFLRDENGRRAVHGDDERFRTDPNWRDLVLFFEYFHGDTGRGLGSAHQTGWTGLVAKMLQRTGE